MELMKEILRCHNGKCYRLLYDDIYEEYYLLEEVLDTEGVKQQEIFNY